MDGNFDENLSQTGKKMLRRTVAIPNRSFLPCLLKRGIPVSPLGNPRTPRYLALGAFIRLLDAPRQSHSIPHGGLGLNIAKITISRRLRYANEEPRVIDPVVMHRRAWREITFRTAGALVCCSVCGVVAFGESNGQRPLGCLHSTGSS